MWGARVDLGFREDEVGRRQEAGRARARSVRERAFSGLRCVPTPARAGWVAGECAHACGGSARSRRRCGACANP